MPLLVNLRQLEKQNLALAGELPVAELELDLRDELIRTDKPLRYQLEIQEMEDSLLVQGCLQLPLECECARCLKPFPFQLKLNPWAAHLPFEGEEKVSIVNDCVDLTPYLREDILLGFPQHPLCETDCRGLPEKNIGQVEKTSGSSQNEQKSSAWATLDKLKLKK